MSALNQERGSVEGGTIERVLIIEDTPADAELAIAVLSKNSPNLAWRCVATEHEFRAALDWQPDAIIADYEVPGFGAMAALGVLRELNSEIPLIVFTGAVTEETVVRCMRMGAADYLLKDRLTRLGPAVANALRMRQERDAKRAMEASQRRLANALRQLSEGVAITDGSLRIVSVNTAFAALTGYEGEQALGRDFSELLVDVSNTQLQDIRDAVGLGGWKGELRARRANGEVFPALFSFSAVRNPAGDVENYTAVFSDLSTFREFERRIEYLSRNDALTGLPNRAALAASVQAAIDRARADGSAFVLLVVELDGFKTINDTIGHAAGDLLLKAVAERLRSIGQAEDVLARVGGDEFGVLALNVLPRTTGARTVEAERFVERIRSVLERPFRIGGHDVFITASLGLCRFPFDGQDFESLLRAATVAVFRAKQLGRNTVVWYSPDMNTASLERFTLQNGLPHALARGEFLLEYQPTVNFANGRVSGAEALLRWRHPQLGLLAPTRFVGLAEDTGLIVPIGDWVLRTACDQVMRWVLSGWSDATVAVNLSARQFNQPDLVARIREALSASAIEAWRLRLEVTESMVMNDPNAAAATLGELAHMGVQIALDDFGTGYSSMNYLKRFQLRCIKVDRCFVNGVPDDVQDESIVRAIVALGKTLGLKIIAEGVETLAQAEFLHDAGCDDGQGYYYSRATSAGEVRALAASAFPHAAGGLQAQLDFALQSA